EHYGDRTSGEGPNQNGLDVDQAIETHLAACDGCRTRVLEFHRSRFGAMSDPFPSAAWQSHPPTAECPSEDALCKLAAGLSSADAARITRHAAQCPHCGPILRAYTEDFSDDLTPEDQALLSKLQSSTPEWQKKMAQQMAAASHARVAQPPSAVFGSPSTKETRVAQPGAPDSPVLAGRGGLPPSAVRVSSKQGPKRGFHLPSLKWVLAPIALAATAVIAFFIWNAQRDTPEKVEKLLAQAYTEQRTIEMRFPDADYAPMRVTRGTDDSRFNKPAPLLQAEGIISRNQQQSENDVQWLQAKAQADILEHNPSSAITVLNDALKTNSDSSSITLQLAIAYFVQGQASSDAKQYEHTVELLSKLLARQPENMVALFNRAIVYEHLQMYAQAAADWNTFLQHETDPGWKGEAEQHLKSIQEKKTPG
ncbi:MAG TPA: tetratricopeptide repeat protein, partial [Candidatus Angelobacter sp.]|nr:tetratricopeptide repeat protein [Candidatus Angelobacter sp.]